MSATQYEVYWWEAEPYECYQSTRFGVFATEAEAEAVAAMLRPADGETDPDRGIDVAPVVLDESPGISAKWHIHKYRDPYPVPTRDDGWLATCRLIKPTGDEETVSWSEGGGWWEAKFYAPTRAEAIARFEQHFGIRFEEDDAA